MLKAHHSLCIASTLARCLPKALAVRQAQATRLPCLLLSRLFLLDMLLGNCDRLPCEELGWRGNPENVMYALAGPWASRLVAIDAVVSRRPPGGLMSAEVS